MNTLKPEVTVRKPNRFLNNLIIGFVAALVTSVVMNIGIRVGYEMGRQDATDRSGATAPDFSATVEDDACGITDPLACVVTIVKISARRFYPQPHISVDDGPRMWHEYGEAAFARNASYVPIVPLPPEGDMSDSDYREILQTCQMDLAIAIEQRERRRGNEP